MYDLLLNLAQPRDSGLSVCTPDPQKVIRMIKKVNSKPKMSGREVNMINTLSKINLSKIGWGVNLNLDNFFKYTVCFFEITPYRYFAFNSHLQVVHSISGRLAGS